MPAKPIRVLIVDDSAVVRQTLSRMLASDPEIEVLATAQDPYIARQRLEKMTPDVITLDLEMPRMDGLTFLKLLMEQCPLPVVVVSSLAQQGSQKALDAVHLGAVEVIAKPGGSFNLGEMGPQLIHKIKAAARSRIARTDDRIQAPTFPSEDTQVHKPAAAATPAGRSATLAPPPPRASFKPATRERATAPIPPLPLEKSRKGQLIVLGASTGGTEALREILMRFPPNTPPVLIVQHIPAYFSRAFAERLNSLCHIQVKEAEDGDIVDTGMAVVAPGDFHMLANRQAGNTYGIQLKQGPMVWHQRPAVDILFKSVASFAGSHVTGAVMTGMGRDGADGLLALREKGAATFAEAEESCVVYGMPKACHDIGAAQEMVPLPRIAETILKSVAAHA